MSETHSYYVESARLYEAIIAGVQLCPDVFLGTLGSYSMGYNDEDATVLTDNNDARTVSYIDRVAKKTLTGMKIVRSHKGYRWTSSIVNENVPLTYDAMLKDERFSAGTYILQDYIILELIISCMASSLLKRELSYNFIDVYGMETSIRSNEFETVDGQCSVYMERLYDVKKVTPGIIIQVLHAIYSYQKHLKLQHNDLTTRNIFIRRLTTEDKFRGETVYDADYFSYYVENGVPGDRGVTIYIPNNRRNPTVACVGDFDIASLWGEQVVFDVLCHTTGHTRPDGRAGRCVPKGYSPMYDPMLFLKGIASSVTASAGFAMQLLKAYGLPTKSKDGGIPFWRTTGRQRLSEFRKLKHIDIADVLLSSECMQQYLIKPEGDVKIVCLGG